MPNNQKSESQNLTQEQIDQTILFANKYPKIHELSVLAGAKISYKDNGKIEIRFLQNSRISDEFLNTLKLQSEQVGFSYTVSIEFDPAKPEEGSVSVIEINQNIIKQKNGDLLDNRTDEQRRKSVL